MPYLTVGDKQAIDSGKPPETPGELTYALQRQVRLFLEGPLELRYANLAEALGAIKGCELDLVERVIRPYEKRKREENGDVWPSEWTGDVDLHELLSRPAHPLTDHHHMGD